MQWPFMVVNTFLVSLTSLVCLFVGASARSFRMSAIGATLGAYLIFAALIMPGIVEETGPKRDQHPVESLADRLAYEKHGRPRTPVEPPVLERLVALEKQLGDAETSRVADLREIHQSYVFQFINSPGFGFIRMIGRNANSAFGTVGASIGATVTAGGGSTTVLPSDGSYPIRQPQDYEEPSLAELFRDPWQTMTVNNFPPRDSFFRMHRNSIVDFANRDSFGYVRDREHVAGFQPHRFTRMPSLERPAGKTECWEIRRLDLVSLLKHDEPVAYVWENLPRMKELGSAPIRALDDIEKRMLTALQKGEDLQVEVAKDRIRMLGSVRAARQCLGCHDVNRGDLLGAFSYKLSRQ
jgi:hypothetical protein